MRPELSVPHSVVRILAAALLALVVVGGLIYIVLYAAGKLVPTNTNKQQAYTEQQKLNILAGLAGTTSLSDEEKIQMLKSMSGGSEVSEQQKADILKSLQSK